MTDHADSGKTINVKPNEITVACKEGEDATLATTRILMSADLSNAYVATRFAKTQYGREIDLPSAVTIFREMTKRVKSDDMSDVEEALVCQATTLNSMFCELSRRAVINMGEYIEASERYMRMALKAQNQCRMTLETLSNIKNPPVVYARQANISNGPQQVNNTLHAHAGENQNPPSKVLEQSNEQRMDSPAQSTTGQSNSELEAVDAGNRSQVS